MREKAHKKRPFFKGFRKACFFWKKTRFRRLDFRKAQTNRMKKMRKIPFSVFLLAAFFTFNRVHAQATDTPTDIPTDTPTQVDTTTVTAIPTDTPTDISTDTPTVIQTDTPNPTNTPTSTPPNTLISTPSPTSSFTPSNTPTKTTTPTYSPTPTATGCGEIVPYINSYNPTCNLTANFDISLMSTDEWCYNDFFVSTLYLSVTYTGNLQSQMTGFQVIGSGVTWVSNSYGNSLIIWGNAINAMIPFSLIFSFSPTASGTISIILTGVEGYWQGGGPYLFQESDSGSQFSGDDWGMASVCSSVSVTATSTPSLTGTPTNTQTNTPTNTFTFIPTNTASYEKLSTR